VYSDVVGNGEEMECANIPAAGNQLILVGEEVERKEGGRRGEVINVEVGASQPKSRRRRQRTGEKLEQKQDLPQQQLGPLLT